MLKTFPTISLEGLSPQQLEAFTGLVNEEICPCNCPKTFAACLQEGTKCKSAQILGQWVVDKMRSGTPAEMLMEPLSREISAGQVSAPQMIDLEGFYSKGAANPKITIVDFADFDCAHCKATATVLDDFVSKHSDEVRLVFKYFPLEQTPASKLAACAVEAAGKQGKFWEMHDAAFRTRTILSRELILGHARALGLKMPQFEKDLDDKEIVAKVEASKREGQRIGIRGTPAIFFNGRLYSLPYDMNGLDMRLSIERVRAESKCD